MIKRILSLLIVLSLILTPGVLSSVTYAEDKTLISFDFEGNDPVYKYWGSGSTENTYPVSEASSSGDKSLFIYDTSKNTAVGLISDYFSVQSGKTYTFLTSAFVIKTKVQMYLRFYDNDNKQLSSKNVSFTRSVWEERAITETAPAGATKAQIIICTVNIDISGAYVDDVKVVEGEVAAKGAFQAKFPAKLPAVNEILETYDIVEDGYENGELIYFQSFEKGIDDWSTYVDDKSYKVVKENATDGENSLYIKDTSDVGSAGAKSKKIPVAQGNTYTVYIDSYIEVKGISLYLRCYDASNKQTSQRNLSINQTGSYIGRLTIVAPTNTTQLEVFFAGNNADLGEGYFDNIRVYKGNLIVKPDETDYKEPVQTEEINAKIVEPEGNKLVYNSYNEKGDTLADFSYAGFYGGELELPDTDKLPLVMTLSPSGTDDDTDMIQKAIDKVYNESKDDRMKVIKLKAGKYNINKNGIKLRSGIVLSGEGQGPTGTILYATGKVNYNVIEIVGEKPVRISDEISIVDDYVKAGSKKVNVSDASEFNVGDLVCIIHPSTEEWIDALKMKDVITVYGDKVSWKKNMLNIKSERTITAINGNEITFDCGLFVPYDKVYAESYIYKIDDSGRVENVGIENLRVQSYFNGDPYDLNHAKMAIYAQKCKNIFVRNITTKNMFNGVFGCRDYATQITVQNCSALEPVSTIVGGNRYPFYADVDTERILFTGCYSFDGRHDYMAVKGTSGPVVFTDSVADMSNACSETHAGFATGVLFDNLYQITDNSKGYFALANRGLYGTDTPQGWTAAGCVAWNCLANSIIVHKPPLSYQNFTVGVWGIYDDKKSTQLKQDELEGYQFLAYRYAGMDVGPDSAFETKDGTPVIGDAYKESEFNPVNPRSLFKAQLAERMTGSIVNAKPNAPIIIYPRPDKEVSTDKNIVAISGIYEMGAEKVSVYVDDIKYTASIAPDNNEFKITFRLQEGIHKIYATQTIDGVEGNKTPDRFVIVGEPGNENPKYLESNYPGNVMSLLLNDSRLTYDEYIEKNAELFAPQIKVRVNNAELETDVKPINVNGRVLVPMRAIFDALEISVSYDETTSTAIAVGEDGKTVKVTNNDRIAYINGEPYELDVPARIIDGRFLVPVRFVSESFKAKVSWNESRQIVTVQGEAPQYTASHGLDNELFAYDIIQSGDDGAGSVIKNAFDGDYSTRWGVLHTPETPGSAYGIIYLGKSKDIENLYISHTLGNERIYTFDIYLSDDNVNYTLVSENNKSSGTSTELEAFPVNAKGRYIKIVSKGNSINNWMNIQEIAITGK